jgi:hypothetical protein
MRMDHDFMKNSLPCERIPQRMAATGPLGGTVSYYYWMLRNSKSRSSIPSSAVTENAFG